MEARREASEEGREERESKDISGKNVPPVEDMTGKWKEHLPDDMRCRWKAS